LRASVSVLLVECGEQTANFATALENAGFSVRSDVSSRPAVGFDIDAFEVVVLGMAEKLEGPLRLCTALRSQGYGAAIIVLGPRASELPTLLDAGADDFAVAPVDPSELVARVRAAVQRLDAHGRTQWGPWSVDRARHSASVRGRALQLTAREYAFVSCLIEAGGAIVSRSELLAKVWNRETDPGSNLLEVQVSRLRSKLGDDARLLETVRGSGYRLRR
jgi:DNA-binding response OmpR family regulator